MRLFSDRLEVWNPGRLPDTLTLESLRGDHPSVPHNPLIAESLYLTRYIERVGSGTQAMIGLCRETGLPEPQFEQRGGFFVVTLWRDWLTAERLARLGLNDRQSAQGHILKTHMKLKSIYQTEFQTATRTASRDMQGIIAKGIIGKMGTTGQVYGIA